MFPQCVGCFQSVYLLPECQLLLVVVSLNRRQQKQYTDFHPTFVNFQVKIFLFKSVVFVKTALIRKTYERVGEVTIFF